MTKEQIQAEWALRVSNGEKVTKEEIREEWKKRLRSGAYEQGRGKLCAVLPACSSLPEGKEYHCCLGVLSEIGVETGILRVEVTGTKKTFVDINFDPEFANGPHASAVCLTDNMRKAVGLFSPSGFRWFDRENGLPSGAALAQLNDEGVTFDAIADQIDSGLYYEKDPVSP